MDHRSAGRHDQLYSWAAHLCRLDCLGATRPGDAGRNLRSVAQRTVYRQPWRRCLPERSACSCVGPTALSRCSFGRPCAGRSEEHTSELQSLMRISYAVFCLKTKRMQIIISSIYNNHSNEIITYTELT